MIKIASRTDDTRRVLKEKNDCTVVAVSEALEISYIEAYAMLIAAGRKKNRGHSIEPLYDKLFKPFPRPAMTVSNYITLIASEGNWIIWVRGYVLAIKSGVIYGFNPNRWTGCHVIKAWRVK